LNNENKEDGIDENNNYSNKNGNNYTLNDKNKNGKDSGLSDEMREALKEMPKPIYDKEEYAPFPIRDGNDLRRTKNQYRYYRWFLRKLPIKKEKLTALMNFLFNKERKTTFPIIRQLHNLDLIKIELDGTIIPTIKFVNFVKDLYLEIERYEKENLK